MKQKRKPHNIILEYPKICLLCFTMFSDNASSGECPKCQTKATYYIDSVIDKKLLSTFGGNRLRKNLRESQGEYYLFPSVAGGFYAI